MIWHKKLITVLAAGLVFVMPVFVLATTPGDPCNGGICNPLGNTRDLGALILQVVEGIAQIGYYVVVLFVIYSGFKFVTARGDVKKLGEAKQTFLFTVIGAAILLGATLIAKVIDGTVTQLKTVDAQYEVLDSNA